MADETTEVQEVKESKKGGGFFSKLIITVLLLALGAGAGIYVAQQKPELFGLSKGAAAVQAQTDATVTAVGKLISLPTDEKPTVATVTDASKLKDQPFFANAKNGDTVLIYQKAAKAILYRQSENRIIEVGAVNINNQGTQVVPTPVASPTTKAKATATPEASTLPSPSSTP